MNLSNQTPVNRFAEGIQLKEYSRGMGALGLPGDLSSASRFVRMAFNKLNSVVEIDVENAAEEVAENTSVGQFFHLLDSVAMTTGAVQMPSGLYDKTVYSCCSALYRYLFSVLTSVVSSAFTSMGNQSLHLPQSLKLIL